MFKKTFPLALLLVFASLPLANIKAQFGYPLGLNPSGTKWYQIKNDSFQIIFPESVKPSAQRVANLTSRLYQMDQTIGDKRRKVSFILHPNTTVPNGFVSLIPFRSELYLSPPQSGFLGSGNWLDLLTIHEYRHVQQNVNARVGITKLASWLFGNNGWALMRQTAIPRWFMEGDAVLYETLLSPAGRGRLAEFNMEYRALRMEGKKYNYEKASAGSLIDFVPDHYKLGYHLSAYGRKNYGESIWKETVNAAAEYDGIFFPFSTHLKKATGKRSPSFYTAAFQELDSLWKAEDQQLKLTEFETRNDRKRGKVIDYRFPSYLKDGNMIALKTSFSQIPSLVKIDKYGAEELIKSQGFQVESNRNLSVKEGVAVWSELRYHVRWGNQNYSDIFRYDLFNGKKKRLTEKGKYVSPSLSADALKVVAVEMTSESQSRLVILNSFSGEVLSTIENPEGYLFIHPAFVSETKVVTVAQKDHQHGLLLVDLKTGKYETLVPFDHNQLTFPTTTADGKIVVYASSETGINNLFAVEVDSKKKFQVTSSRFGAFQPAVSPDGKMIAYTDFSSMGYTIREIPFQQEKWKLIDQPLKNSNDYFEPLQEQEGEPLVNLSEDGYEIKRYREVSQLINFHSIRSMPLHPNYLVEVQSDNTFSTLSARVGANYNANDENTTYYASLAYGRYFPVFEAGFQAGTERSKSLYFARQVLDEETPAQDTVLNAFGFSRIWTEKTITGGVTLPFNLSAGTSFGTLRVSAYMQQITTEFEPDFFRKTPFEETSTASDIRVQYSQTRQMARQHINPMWGVLVNLRRRELHSGLTGKVFYFNTRLYVPGLLPNHSIWGEFGLNREKVTNDYLFPNNFFFARGYDGLRADRVQKASFNYSLPLFYPDMAIGPFFFIQRVKANFFYDQSLLEISPYRFPVYGLENPEEVIGSIEFPLPFASRSQRSAGAELTFDFRFLRLIDMDLGVRWSYLMDAQENRLSANNRFEIVINSLGF